MNKLPISIGILAWHSGQTLIDTLTTYHERGLFSMVSDTTILFQQITLEDVSIANHFGLDYIGLRDNIGIGTGLLKLARTGNAENILLLEHDWKLVESAEVTYDRLKSGLELLDEGFHCVRYRHRRRPGHPHFSIQKYKGRELEYFDDWYHMKYPHLLDSVHWVEAPDVKFPEWISLYKDHYVSPSRVGNYTNNPCLYRRKFYIDINEPFIDQNGEILSEGHIAIWWANQPFKVAHGEGLFQHVDPKKYPGT